jgi:hypothetical protein
LASTPARGASAHASSTRVHPRPDELDDPNDAASASARSNDENASSRRLALSRSRARASSSSSPVAARVSPSFVARARRVVVVARVVVFVVARVVAARVVAARRSSSPRRSRAPSSRCVAVCGARRARRTTLSRFANRPSIPREPAPRDARASARAREATRDVDVDVDRRELDRDGGRRAAAMRLRAAAKA